MSINQCIVCATSIKPSRKYCSLCYKEIYIKIKLKQPRKKALLVKLCDVCNTEYPIYNFYKNNSGKYYRSSCKDCFNKMIKTRQNSVKQQCVDYKGGKCQKCGYNKCIAALEFHHLDPREKDINISKIKLIDINKYTSELDKCILLCSNCHRETHFSA